MEVAVYNIKGEDTGRKVMLNDAVFAVETPSDSNPAHVIYLDVKQYLANQRQGTSHLVFNGYYDTILVYYCLSVLIR